MASGRSQLITVVGLLFATVVSAQGDATKQSVELQACRNATGACVTKEDCSVPTFRLRGDGCPSDLECCPIATVTVAIFDIVNRTENSITTSIEAESEEIVEWSTDDIATEIVTEKPNPPQLTTTKPTSTTTLPTKPREAERSENNAPWLATIFNVIGSHCCHGALISDRIVLTASTCWSKCTGQPSSWTVRVGLRQSHSPSESRSWIDVKVKNGVKHYRFNSRNRDNNIAVLHLKGAIELNPHIELISLPTQEDSINNIEGNLLYTGWDGTFALNPRQNILKPIELKQINDTYCKATIKENQKGTSLPTDKSLCVMVNCPNEEPTSACNVENHRLLCAGHAGGPVVAKLPDNRHVLYGLISRCYTSGKPHVPTLVTNVFDLQSWIYQKLNEYQ